MHVTLLAKHAAKHPSLERLFQREVERVRRRLAGVPLDLVSLHAEVEGNVHVKEGYAQVRLALPDAVLSARGVGANVHAALRDATAELLRELRRHRGKVERHDGRLRFRERVLALGFDAFEDLGGVSERKEADHAPAIRATLPQLRAFVAREWERHARLDDELHHGEPDLDDVVEESVLEALQREGERPADVPFDRWLFTCAYEVLLREEDRLRKDVELVPMLDDPDTPFDLPETAEPVERAASERAEALSFASAGEAGDGEGRRVLADVLRAVRRLPRTQSEALSLVALAGMAERDAARRLRCSEGEVAERVRSAREELRARLESRAPAVRTAAV